MTTASLLSLLAEVERGVLTAEAAASRLATLPYEDLGHTRVDHHRSLRTGLPEVIYAAGKTAEQTAEIFARLAASGSLPWLRGLRRSILLQSTPPFRTLFTMRLHAV